MLLRQDPAEEIFFFRAQWIVAPSGDRLRLTAPSVPPARGEARHGAFAPAPAVPRAPGEMEDQEGMPQSCRENPNQIQPKQ